MLQRRSVLCSLLPRLCRHLRPGAWGNPSSQVGPSRRLAVCADNLHYHFKELVNRFSDHLSWRNCWPLPSLQSPLSEGQNYLQKFETRDSGWRLNSFHPWFRKMRKEKEQGLQLEPSPAKRGHPGPQWCLLATRGLQQYTGRQKIPVQSLRSFLRILPFSYLLLGTQSQFCPLLRSSQFLEVS